MNTVAAAGPAGISEALNQSCFCFSLDPAALAQSLDAQFGDVALAQLVAQRCPFVFAAQPVFVAPEQLQRMAQVVQAVESVVALPAFRSRVLAAAPAIARAGVAGPRGVLFGYDFHLGGGRLGLIEINTNAGGAMLNTMLARAQRACCPGAEFLLSGAAGADRFEQQMVAMFRQEWHLAGRSRPLQTIAIVDEAPHEQYLYPEFLLFQRLFARHGIQAVIAAPAELVWRDGALWHGDVVIDLVYNRLTDFYLEQTANAPLRDAWVADATVLTPNPQTHALFANKRLLALFSDAAELSALGVPHALQKLLLAHVPRTEVVDPSDAQRLWDTRRGLFFKPASGFGSRAAYRGDKLTRRVWQEILAGDYVAQVIVAPGERRVEPGDDLNALKFDLRAYAYDGNVMWTAARLYQGQTTNFRTPGGGFAPVYSAPPSVCAGLTSHELDAPARRPDDSALA